MLSNIQFLLNNEHRLLGLMIFSLLAAIHVGNSDTLAQSFLFVHFGFFLLWQPVIKQQSSFSVIQLFILVILIFAYVYFFNPWLNAFWSLLLLTLLTVARCLWSSCCHTIFRAHTKYYACTFSTHSIVFNVTADSQHSLNNTPLTFTVFPGNGLRIKPGRFYSRISCRYPGHLFMHGQRVDQRNSSKAIHRVISDQRNNIKPVLTIDRVLMGSPCRLYRPCPTVRKICTEYWRPIRTVVHPCLDA